MKKTFLFAIMLLSLAVCFGQDTSPSITLSQAFAHCASTGSYWLWIGIAVVFDLLVVVELIRYQKKNEVASYWVAIICFVLLSILMLSVFKDPVNVHVNTSVNMAAQNKWLGY
jgi:hypothetical protein